VAYDKLTRETLPVLHAIVAETGHSARLSVQDADELIYLIGVEGPHFIDSGWRAGTWLPWHGSSAGRILLAFLQPEEVERILARKPTAAVTQHTVTDPDELKRILDRARERGYDFQRNELTVGVGTVAVPIFGPQQRPIGALSIAFPAHEVKIEEDEGFAMILHKRAKQISLRMGSLVYAAGSSLENRTS
jgi:DNA-binding IclR family transcriptional regulator